MKITIKQFLTILLILFTLIGIILLIVYLKNLKPKNPNHPSKCDWVTGDWNDCSNNTQTRTVICKNTDGTCDASSCTSSTKPLSSQSCIPSPFTFPSNVYIFSPNTLNIQNTINNIFLTQGGVTPDNNGQFSLNNYAFLFMPGTYNVDIPIGYYTHVAGLGMTNDKVTINGGPVVNNGSNDHTVGSLNNFWRTCENMTVNPITNQKSMIFAVSQATSLRSVNINGNLNLGAIATDGNMGYASGGFMANCKISGELNMGSQQQFLCRNTEYNLFPTALWNQVNVGCKQNNHDNIDSCCINTPTPIGSSKNLTIINETPSIMEKPYLAVTKDNDFNTLVIMYPLLTQNTKGNTITTQYISKDNYKIVDDKITALLLNKLLSDSNNKCIIFSPGRYKIDSPINLKGQLLFGLGIPVLRSTKNNNIITGFGQICGIIFETSAGGDGTNILVNLTTGKSYLWDISCRVGGGDENTDIYSIDKMLYVGGDDSILDNVWCWVADHYSNNKYTGWTKASCNIGVHVTGNNVIAYGLFSEHNHNRNVLWDGDYGQVYMFQSEFNYFPPSQKDFSDSVSYEVSSNVKKHTLKGAGAYSFFPEKPIMATSGFKFNINNVDYETIFTVFLNGTGGITNVINNTGPTVEFINGKGTQIAIICNKTDSCRWMFS